MIAEILELSTKFEGKTFYSEKKCNNEVAELLDKNLYSDNPKDFIKDFYEVADQNTRVKKPCWEVSLSLVPGEEISKEKFIELGREYLNRMGYENNPYLMYLHSDTDHSHIHIIASTVQYDGKWTDDAFSRERSFKISRELEIKYNLIPALENKLGNEKKHSLSEKAMLTYSFRNGLRRAYYDKKALTFLDSYITREEKEKILKYNSFNNNKCINFLSEKKFNLINDYLIEHSYCAKHIKGEMLKILDEASKEKTKDDFFKFVENNNIEVSLFSQKGNSRYSYKIKDYDYIIKESSLPRNYRYETLVEKYGDYKGTYIPEAEQKHILYNSIRANVQHSISLQDFFENCSRSNIKCSFGFKDDKTTKPHLEFSIKNLDNEKTFKGEEIFEKFTFENIQRQFSGIEQKIEPLKEETLADNYEQYPNYNIPISFSAGSGEQEQDTPDDLLSRKKKKRKKDNLRDISKGI